MEYAIKIKEKYKITLEESVDLYNATREYYKAFQFGKSSSKSVNKVHDVLDNFINENDRINKYKLISSVKESFITSEKGYFRKNIIWPELYNKSITPKNSFFPTSSSEIAKEKEQNSDRDHFYITNLSAIGMKGFFLNESTEHKDLTSTAIVTDDKRIANHNLIRNEAIDTKPYEFNKNRESLYYHSTKLVNAQGRPYKIANDPLILDLNGDGVKTASYTEKPVLFFC